MSKIIRNIGIILAIAAAIIWLIDWGYGRPRLRESTPVATSTVSTTTIATLGERVATSSTFVEVIDGCGPYFGGPCLNVRSGPGTSYPVVAKLRTGVVLKSAGSVERAGRTWYKIVFDEWLRYPERVEGDWYVAGDYVRAFQDGGTKNISTSTPKTTKRIIVDRSEQMLYAYDGDALFLKAPISTGLELTPTPRGTFSIFKKTPSRYMQGPIPGVSDQEYDLPGVPWNLYFTAEGAVIHGAYWHDHFGEPWSHGCVNLPPETAKELYYWADLGTKVTVRD